MENEHPAIIIDNGSDTCKVGVSGDDAPSSYFPSIIAKRNDNTNSETTIFVGNKVLSKTDESFTISHPVQYRQITCWEDIEHLWRYCFDLELGLNPEDQSILLTEPPLVAKADREKMIHTIFEEFKVPNFYVGVQATLALYSTGRTTGIVLDSGHEVTHTMPIYEGHSFPHVIGTTDFGGNNLTRHLKSMIEEKDLDLELVRDIKEKLCSAQLYCSDSIKREIQSSKPIEYKLPDGQVIEISSDCLFRCPEILFNPSSYGKQNFKSIQNLVYDSIHKCSDKFRDEMYRNIILSGGSTLLNGFAERLEKEINGLTSHKLWVKVVAPVERKFSTWIGGSILASLTAFQSMWITKAEYEEIGPPIIHQKCF